MLFTNNEAPFDLISFDTRRIPYGNDVLFVAIKGKSHNGHQFLPEAHRKGVRNFLVSDASLVPELLSDSSVLLVDDVYEALRSLASTKRRKGQLDLVGITGSNGKTIVKEWLNQLMAEDLRIVRTPRSYNSQLGVPLSMWNIEGHHDLAIMEAGISQSGEMEILESCLQPDIGIFLNVGNAHLENFGTKEHIAREKSQLFKNASHLIRSADYEEINTICEELNQQIKQHRWSVLGDEADLILIRKTEVDKGLELELSFHSDSFTCSIPFRDNASVENAMACILFMLIRGYSYGQIAERLPRLSPVAMRMEVLKGINNCKLINDSYNSDLFALGIALDLMDQQAGGGETLIILSDLKQTGLPKQELYTEVARMLRAHRLNRIICIGPELVENISHFPEACRSYRNTEEFIRSFEPKDYQNLTILLKGARDFGFERIAALLQKKLHDTVLEIDLNKMVHNLQVYRSLIEPKTRVMAVVKAFAYGTGCDEIASLLEYRKVDYLAVAYTDEGIALRKAGISMPIMVMNPQYDNFSGCIRYRLEPEISRFGQLKALIATLEKEDLYHYPIHLKLDTGMNRLGFKADDMQELLSLIDNNNERLRVIAVFSHLAASEAREHQAFTEAQIEQFKKMSSEIEALLNYPFLRHICNSAAIKRHPEAHFDMVRLGIGLYGVDPSGEITDLQTVGTLKTIISQVKTVKAGESIGYGRAYIAKEDKHIAIIPIGYADGYRRALSNGLGKVIIKGKCCPVIGNICMDMTMVDIGKLEVSEGEQVIIMSDEIPPEEIAKWLNTIAYEVLTSIPPRVKRVFLQE